MLYFKHSDLAKKYAVSLRTVHNWIDETREGKLDLTLHREGDKLYVANIARNIDMLSELTESRRKYRNSIAIKTVEPLPEFYETYSQKQIFDIATNLEIHHEIPRQYNYFDGGANYWDKYAERLDGEESPNLVNSTVRLLKANQSYIDNLLDRYKRVNVIDVGVGNAYPVKGLLTHLLDAKKLGRYIALDVSPTMLAIARINIKKWFGDTVAFEGYEHDINYDRFSDLFIREYAQSDAKETVNLVLLLGGTLSNMRKPDSGLKIIHDSMGINDILIHSTKLDTEATRSFFDFDLKPGETRLAAIHGLVVNLLGIDSTYYKVELGYDPKLKQRFEQIRLNVSLTIKLKFEDGERPIHFNKGDTILTWRGLQQTAADVNEQFDRNDFYLLHSSQTDSREYILTVSKVKHG
ncbi:MAG TPA: L-histidine N(alpha)-methyltransferase [Candidatus Saccharimonadales bacterium]|nr:L-histidine N(alpha)-methyltransferase [Candidatus Saccharimonadales bacterium]